MDNLSNIFGASKEFNVEKSTLGQSENFVTKLVSKGAVENDGLMVKSSTTLYVSLTKQVAEGESVTIDPLAWNFFEVDYQNPETGEDMKLKWITPKA